MQGIHHLDFSLACSANASAQQFIFPWQGTKNSSATGTQPRIGDAATGEMLLAPLHFIIWHDAFIDISSGSDAFSPSLARPRACRHLDHVAVPTCGCVRNFARISGMTLDW